MNFNISCLFDIRYINRSVINRKPLLSREEFIQRALFRMAISKISNFNLNSILERTRNMNIKV